MADHGALAPSPVASDDPQGLLAAVYEHHYPLLVGLAVRRFRISETDAQTLAHEVFLDYVIKSENVIDETRWLLGAISNASRYFLRKQARGEALPEDFDAPDPLSERVADVLPEQLIARECIACLTPRCQLALRLRYFEGYSIPEVAAEMRTTSKYAQKVVGDCLRQAQRRYAQKEASCKAD